MDPLNILTGKYSLRSIKPLDLNSCTKEQILEYFENSYNINESLFTTLASEDAFYKCPDRLRLPLIFYYTHTAVVYWNKMMLAGLVEGHLDIYFETMFETGVDEQSWDDTENYRMGGSFKWPPLAEVVEYRRKVRNSIRKIISDTPLQLPIDMESPWWALSMGFAHERIHIDTSSVLIQQLPIDFLRRPHDWRVGPASHGDGMGENKMIAVPACEVTLGKPNNFPSYGWDNEYPECVRKVPAFEATQYMITNKEFLEFVQSGCYGKKQYWSKEGWQWRNFRKVNHPIFWVCTKGCVSNCGGVLAGYTHCDRGRNGQTSGRHGSSTTGTSNGYSNSLPDNNNESSEEYRLRTLCEEIAMPWDWPVTVNTHEAKAYAKWKGPEFRIMTEAEHHAIRDKPALDRLDVSFDHIFHNDLQKKFNVNLNFSTCTPVNLYPPNKSGFYDVFGNLWEWLEDNFNGLPTSVSHYLYDDFSTPTYDGRHNMLLGGCWITSGAGMSCFGRYSFRRHFYQHGGFRVVRSLDLDAMLPVTLVSYDTDKEICFPMGTKVELVPTTNTQFQQEAHSYLTDLLQEEYSATDGNLLTEVAKVCKEAVKARGGAFSRALDLACGCGKLSFELSKFMGEIVGIDYCDSLIKAAEKIQQNGSYKTMLPDGRIIAVEIPAGANPSCITLKQLTWVPNEILDFDLVVMQGIDRVMNMKAWLLRLWEVIIPNGVVVILSKKGYGAKDFQPIIGRCLELTEARQMTYTQPSGNVAVATLTIWNRK